jgi:hypothetical protein
MANHDRRDPYKQCGKEYWPRQVPGRYEISGRYAGLIAGMLPTVTLDSASVLVKPEASRRQIEADRRAEEETDSRATGDGVGVRVAVHGSRQNDPNPLIWQAGQDYRAADAIHAARTQSTRTRHGPERVGPER